MGLYLTCSRLFNVSLFILGLIRSSQTTLLLFGAVHNPASLLPSCAGHAGRLLRPDVWELHAAHFLLRLLARLHLGKLNLGLHASCVSVRKPIGAVLLVVFFPPSRQS